MATIPLSHGRNWHAPPVSLCQVPRAQVAICHSAILERIGAFVCLTAHDQLSDEVVCTLAPRATGPWVRDRGAWLGGGSAMKVGVLQFFGWPDRSVPIASIYDIALERI